MHVFTCDTIAKLKKIKLREMWYNLSYLQPKHKCPFQSCKMFLKVQANIINDNDYNRRC